MRQTTSDQELELLDSILEHMIPASEDGRMPGAGSVGFWTYVESKGEASWICSGLALLLEAASAEFGLPFSQLSMVGRTEFIAAQRRKQFRFFSRLTHQVIECYYQDARVLRAIGLETRPPFPDGFRALDGDLSLLEPVFIRGKIYRG